MTFRTIVTIPDPVLRRKARKVTDFGPELQTLVDDMVDTMREAPGLGLAAPQVGVPLRAIVVEYGDEADETVPAKLFVIINPEITRTSQDTVIGTEGCLSIPGYAGDVDRFKGVTIRGLNRHGQPMRVKAEGWLARVFQHEIDHLEGVLFPDRAERVWKIEDEPNTPVPLD